MGRNKDIKMVQDSILSVIWLLKSIDIKFKPQRPHQHSQHDNNQKRLKGQAKGKMCWCLTLTLHYFSLCTCKKTMKHTYNLVVTQTEQVNHKPLHLSKFPEKIQNLLVMKCQLRQTHRLAILIAMARSLSLADWGVFG